jgi:hypothetical protein
MSDLELLQIQVLLQVIKVQSLEWVDILEGMVGQLTLSFKVKYLKLEFILESLAQVKFNSILMHLKAGSV